MPWKLWLFQAPSLRHDATHKLPKKATTTFILSSTIATENLMVRNFGPRLAHPLLWGPSFALGPHKFLPPFLTSYTKQYCLPLLLTLLEHCVLSSKSIPLCHWFFTSLSPLTVRYTQHWKVELLLISKGVTNFTQLRNNYSSLSKECCDK